MTLPVLAAPLITSVFFEQPILIVIYLVTVGVAAWLFRDALRRDKSIPIATAWAIGVLLLPPIVFFTYLYFRLKYEGSLSGPPISNSE